MIIPFAFVFRERRSRPSRKQSGKQPRKSKVCTATTNWDGTTDVIIISDLLYL